MPLCYIPYIPAKHSTELPLLLGQVWFPSTFYKRGADVMTYHTDSYAMLPNGCLHGIPGKWLTCHIFVPPLALFADYVDAQHMLTVHLESLNATR